MRIAEVELDHAFAETLERAPDFQHWLLASSRFSWMAEGARLLVSEQTSARKARHWWKHWWCELPDGSQSETDIFAVFEGANGLRFALHVEDKPCDGVLTLRQAADYRRRAIFMARKERYLSYQDFETILIAPRSFIDAHLDCQAQFDRAIAYEALARHIPLFGQAIGAPSEDASHTIEVAV
jgi:hypothetical protein